MQEHLIDRQPYKSWQKWLNQWRHDYDITIVNTQFHDDQTVSMFIIRKPKQVS